MYKKDDYKIQLINDQRVLSLEDRLSSTLIMAPPNSQELSKRTFQLINQDLDKIKKGIPLSIVIIETSSERSDRIKQLCNDSQIPVYYINPQNLQETASINPLEVNDPVLAAESAAMVIKTAFKEQEELFSYIQQNFIRNVVYMLKELELSDQLQNEKEISFNTILECITNKTVLEDYTNLYKVNIKKDPYGYKKNIFNYFSLEFPEIMETEIFTEIKTKLYDFVTNPAIDTILNRTSFDLKTVLEAGKSVILLNNEIEAENNISEILVEICNNLIVSAISSRKTSVPIAYYISEYDRYFNNLLNDLLSGSRQYKVMITLTTQDNKQDNWPTRYVESKVANKCNVPGT